VLSAGQLSGDNADILTPPTRPVSQSIATQTLSTAPLSKVFEVVPDSPLVAQNVAITYSKAVQTTELWSQQSRIAGGSFSDSENEGTATRTPKASKRLSRRERERDEEIRGSLRKEIEEELKAAKQISGDGSISQSSQTRYPLRALTNDELNAVTASDDFLDFVERSSKVIERALDEEYDVLADYARGGGTGNEDDDDEYGAIRGKKRRGIREVAQFWDERWSKKRMISDISFSPKVGPRSPSASLLLLIRPVPRTSPRILHQKPFGTTRPRRPPPSLESPPPQPPRIHLPQHL
jgi:dynein intermediate chain, cytosolic